MNKSAFTLIEIIITMVIVGILATISFGAMTNISQHTKQGAMPILKQIKDSIVMCQQFGGNSCDQWGHEVMGRHVGLDMNDPSDRNFKYTYVINGDNFHITARSDANSIELIKNETGEIIQ